MCDQNTDMYFDANILIAWCQNIYVVITILQCFSLTWIVNGFGENLFSSTKIEAVVYPGIAVHMTHIQHIFTEILNKKMDHNIGGVIESGIK